MSGFFFTERFNRFDVIWIMVAGLMVERSGLLAALAVVLVGATLSVIGEHFCEPPAEQSSGREM